MTVPRPAGVTLIELVVTISLAAILAIPVGLLLSEHLTGALRARDATVATHLARYEMELLDSQNDFFTLASVAPQPNYQGYPYTLTRAVTCLLGDCTSTATTSQGVKRIEVTVTKTGSSDPLATLVTYRTKHVSFGS